jgi:hypothetical protein
MIYNKAGQAVEEERPDLHLGSYNAVIISELAGKVEFESIEENATYRRGDRRTDRLRREGDRGEPRQA